MEQKEACFAHASHVWLAVNHNITTLKMNEYNVRSVLHGQVSLAAANQIRVNHEATNGCKNLKIY